jgi:hypothetical protein
MCLSTLSLQCGCVVAESGAADPGSILSRITIDLSMSFSKTLYTLLASLDPGALMGTSNYLGVPAFHPTGVMLLVA